LEDSSTRKWYRVVIEVKEVRGYCPVYKVGDRIVVEKFYVDTARSSNICMHALVSMATLLSAFMKGYSAKLLGIGDRDDIGYVQCPDPGPPYTRGGTVIFELKREVVE